MQRGLVWFWRRKPAIFCYYFMEWNFMLHFLFTPLQESVSFSYVSWSELKLSYWIILVAECFHMGTTLQYELILFWYHTGLLCQLCFLEWGCTQLLLNKSHFLQSSLGEVSVCVPVHLQGQFVQTFVFRLKSAETIQLSFLTDVPVRSHPS